MTIQYIMDLLFGIFFVKKCALCGCGIKIFDGVCSICWQKIYFISGHVCRGCATPLDPFSNGYCSTECFHRTNNLIAGARAAVIYERKIASVIHQFKYEDKIHHLNFLTKLLLYAYSELGEEVDLIVPVPMHKQRLYQSGYNQAALLSNALASKIKKRCIHNLILKTKHVAKQMTLSEQHRFWNVRKAFIINKKNCDQIKNATVLIVDDVITTGATVMECARVLKQYGARSVFALSVAKTAKFHVDNTAS